MLPSFRFVLSMAVLSICAPERAARGPGQATVQHDWARERWAAQWIACPEAPQRDAGVFHYRKTFVLTDLPNKFVVHVSADNRFILFADGARVGEGPVSGLRLQFVHASSLYFLKYHPPFLDCPAFCLDRPRCFSFTESERESFAS